MILPVEFSAEATAELAEAAAWYESQRSGYGETFLAAIDAATDQCGRWPRSGPLVEDITSRGEVRRAPIARFPFHVAYVASGGYVRVLAVAHDRRKPGYWGEQA